MKKIAACAVMTLLGSTSVFRGLAAHARTAEPAEQQWSRALECNRQSGAPVAALLSAGDRRAPAGARPPPGREVTPSLTEPKE